MRSSCGRSELKLLKDDLRLSLRKRANPFVDLVVELFVSALPAALRSFIRRSIFWSLRRWTPSPPLFLSSLLIEVTHLCGEMMSVIWNFDWKDLIVLLTLLIKILRISFQPGVRHG